MLHGREAAEAAAETARTTFAGGGAGEDLPTLSIGEGSSIVHALTALGFTPSNKEAKRKIAEGAVRLDDVTVSDPALIVDGDEQPMKLSLGKKRHALLVRYLSAGGSRWTCTSRSSIRNWREFLKEYAIIVIGVLTALLAEQAVQSIEWQHKVRCRDCRYGTGTQRPATALNPMLASRCTTVSPLVLRHSVGN